MDLTKYKELTGITVPSSQEARVKAAIRRTKVTLESMLGFSLKPKNLYTEKGKVQFEGTFPNEDLDNLLDPDTEQGTYKLFPYDENDRYFHVDPFTNVYAVKLVLPINDGEFITVTNLDNVAKSYGRDGIGKFIERHYEWFTWAWYSTWRLRWTADSDAGLMLAVDADWVDCYPDDLLFLWADMVTYYSHPDYSVMGNTKSESVDGHSWTKSNPNGNAATNQAPEGSVEAKQLIKRYAGPFGSVARNRAR